MAPASESTERNIVIIGGSYGGVSTAHYLLKHAIPSVTNKDRLKVILISAAAEVMCRPACPRALISDELLPQDKLFVNIAKIFEQYPKGSFQLLRGTVVDLDHSKRTVTVDTADGHTETVAFYAAVIATGARTHSPLLGYTKDERHLRETWAAFRKALPDAQSIVIAGGGPSAIETAGELGEYLNGRASMFSSKLENPKVKITVISGAAKILPQLRESLARTAESYLAKVGVTVLKGSRVASTSPASAGTLDVASPCTVTLEHGDSLTADLYIPAYGTTPNSSFMSTTLLEADGRIKTNPKTLRIDNAGPRIYAIGDVASYTRPAVHHILEAVPVLGANIKRDLLLDNGDDKAAAPADREFKADTRETQMVPIGKSKGVGAAMGYRMPSFLVWLIKGRDYWLWTTGNLWSGKQWAKEK